MNVSSVEIEDALTTFKYDITIKEVNPILNVLYPELQIAEYSQIDGYYNGSKNSMGLNVLSDYVSYNTVQLNNIYAIQEVSNHELLALIDEIGRASCRERV